jgi:aspartate racemase
MKTIGLIGGMSWESSQQYYSIINQEVRNLLGKSHSAKIIMYSFDFQEIEELQYAGKWIELKKEIYKAGEILKKGNVDFIVLCTNTMHKVMDTFENEIGIPLVHIVDVIGEELTKDNVKRIGLLGTKFTMEEDFYRIRIEEKYNIEVIIPDKIARDEINRIIYQELVRGIIKEESQIIYSDIMEKLLKIGSEGIILGCTEIGLLIKESKFKLYDTTILHAKKAAYLSIL